jgi:hypothetical protein
MFKARVFSGYRKLSSAFVVEEDSNIYFDCWILYSREAELDYEDLPTEDKDDLPENVNWNDMTKRWNTRIALL